MTQKAGFASSVPLNYCHDGVRRSANGDTASRPRKTGSDTKSNGNQLKQEEMQVYEKSREIRRQNR
ncbi:hypothetical protein AB9F45_12290 [Rhizobium leguminosarum]|uniref:hypothetical protein n=1 Tax=Rhizobium leguminosarum TaxID=384 RepID=UPI003F9E5F3D